MGDVIASTDVPAGNAAGETCPTDDVASSTAQASSWWELVADVGMRESGFLVDMLQRDTVLVWGVDKIDEQDEGKKKR